MAQSPGFDLFNGLTGTITVETSEPPERIGQLWNLKSTPTAQLVDVKWKHPDVYQPDNDHEPFRPLTEEELGLVVLDEETIRVNSFACLPGPGAIVEHRAPNGKNFTIRDMIAVVEETERQTRGDTEWFGGIDVHHIFFEGMKKGEDGVWTLQWGS